jgi:flagellar biosynthesis chaperone FliJ
MKKKYNMVSLSAIGLLLLTIVFATGGTATAAGLDTITAELTNCQENYLRNTRVALDSIGRLKNSYGELVPTLVKVVDSKTVATFGMFVDKLEQSITNRDTSGAATYLQVLEKISKEFQGKLGKL